jgi:hypothetical protein
MKKALIRMLVNILTNVSECPSWYRQYLVSPARILYLSAYLTTGPTVYRFQEIRNCYQSRGARCGSFIENQK